MARSWLRKDQQYSKEKEQRREHLPLFLLFSASAHTSASAHANASAIPALVLIQALVLYINGSIVIGSRSLKVIPHCSESVSYTHLTLPTTPYV